MNCPNCNKPISSEDRFCRDCGYKLKFDKEYLHKEPLPTEDFYAQKIPNKFVKKMLYWYQAAFRKYLVFRGRASRAEFWYYMLFFYLVLFGIIIFIEIFASEEEVVRLKILLVIWVLINFMPYLTVTIRRLHDLNLSGWWILLKFIPFVGEIMLLIILAQKGDLYDNQYGSNPEKLYQTEKAENYNNIKQLGDKLIYCSKCYYKNKPNNNFCTNCGTKLTKNELS